MNRGRYVWIFGNWEIQDPFFESVGLDEGIVLGIS